ncbi:MAG: polysaccharide biosynthesis tyrosine autokinase [Terracidiphilus sp.]
MILEHQPEPPPLPPLEARPAAGPLGERRSLMDVWRVLTKQRFAIITVTVLFMACAVWYAFRTPPVYESISRIEIKPNEYGGGDILGLLEAEDESAESLATEVRILQSDSVLFDTARALHLLYMVRGKGKNGTTDMSAEVTPQERRALIGIVRGGLSVAVILNTRLVEIRYRSNDPKMGTDIANQLVETYSDAELQTKFERTEHVSKWLQNRMDDLRQEASDTQRSLADYQRQHNIVGTDENNLTIQTLQNISSELDSAEADRIMKEARMHDFDTLSPDMTALMGDNQALSALRSQLTDLQTQRAELASKFGPKHPQMQQLDQEIQKVQNQIDNEVELARRQVTNEYKGALGLEDELKQRLAAQEDAAYRLNSDVAQYAILRHQAELTRDLYDTLQMRLKEASISAGMSAANITVVDRATVPFVPIAPQKSKALLYGFFGGLFVGCVLAFVIESIDDRLRTSEEVEAASMLPSLAAIPNMSYSGPKFRGDIKSPSTTFQTPHQLITIWDPKSHGAEAYRGLRSSLLLSSIDNPPRVIVITSAFPSEGKTTTAINFAIVLAQRGEQVLLVDADLRRGSLRRVFGISDENVGLSTALSQQALDKELPVPFPELPSLYVLPTGPLPPNPAEMLSSNRMEEQMRQWVKRFDRIVIDSAPLLAVSDTQSLAVRSDAVVLVARAGVTRKRALIRARDLLWRVNAPIAGVVVNDVDLRLENFYTYRYGAYARNYWYGYKQVPSFSDRAYGYEEEEQKDKGV